MKGCGKLAVKILDKDYTKAKTYDAELDQRAAWQDVTSDLEINTSGKPMGLIPVKLADLMN